MRNLLVAAGVAVSLAFASYLAFTPATDAGWGPPFACGAGPNTSNIGWDASIPEPGAKKPVITGILADKKKKKDASSDEEWTVEELQAAKPLLVYRYLDGSMDSSLDSYKFSQSFEVKILAKDKVIAQLNKSWRAKRSPIDAEADQKKAENQAAILFYSFTGKKLGELSLKSRMSSRNFISSLKKYEAKNKALCAKEIKRIEKIEKMKAKAEADKKSAQK